MVAFDEARYPTSTRLGTASEVTLITPIKKGRIEGEYRTYRQRLQDVLDDLRQRELEAKPTPISVIRQIHFARWVILPPPGGGDGGSLLFTSNFDGEMKFYFRNFALDLTDDIDRVWENCEGYPGARDFDRLWQYVKEHQIETTAFYDAYRTLTVPQISKLEELKSSFDDLVCKIGSRSGAGQEVVEGAQKLCDELRALLKCAQSTVPSSSLDETERKQSAATRALERDDIQVNILGSPPWQQAGYYFLTVRDPQAFREGLWRLIQRGKDIGFVTARDFDLANNARKGASKSSSGAAKDTTSTDIKRAVTVAFSWSGLERIGLATEHLVSLPLAFRQGMAARAQMLGDLDEWSPDKWDGMLGRKNIHVLISAFSMEAKVAEYWEEITDVARGGNARAGAADFVGCKLVHTELGNRIGTAGTFVEPFGFRDGIGQPEIEADDPNRAVAAGEFILGYKDVDGNDQIAQELVGAPVRALCRNGTFMVFRKIEQDVAAFKTFSLKHGDDLAMRLMGRRRDGTSLVLDGAEAKAALANGNLDNFNYRDDPTGARCPLASHARRANPRNNEVRRHRIIRRGIPYDQDGKQGMLFVCFNARIDTQFEFLQSEWCKKGDFLGYFTEVRDPIVGGGGSFVDPRAPVPYALKSFVTVKGGDYFFVPGLKALDGVVHGSFDMPSTTPAVAGTLEDAPPESFDPLGYIEGNELLVKNLLQNRGIEQKYITWPSGRRQAIYYVACRDHVRQILADDTRFTSAQYARKIENLLADYDHTPWLQQGEKAGSEGLVLRRVLLGMPASDAEKQARLQILKQALGASDLPSIRLNVGKAVQPIAEQVVNAVLDMPANSHGLDVVRDIAYRVPLARAIKYFGFPESTGFSDAYKALYFGRTSINDVRRFGWLNEFPTDPSVLPPELFGLVHPIAIFLLIDDYDTASSLEYARVAVKELLNRLAKAAIAEEELIDSNTPTKNTLLSLMLRVPRAGVDPATFRLRVGMTLVELIVGGIDTAAKGITNVVDCLLSNPDALKLARDSVEKRDELALNDIVLEALRCQPAATMIIRECPKDAFVQLNAGAQQREYRFEAGSRLFLLTSAAMRDPVGIGPPGVDLSSFVLNQSSAIQEALNPIRRLGFGDGAHDCLGSEIVLTEIREVLKQLVTRKNFRRAAGPEGKEKEQFALPVSLKVRFDS